MRDPYYRYIESLRVRASWVYCVECELVGSWNSVPVYEDVEIKNLFISNIYLVKGLPVRAKNREIIRNNKFEDHVCNVLVTRVLNRYVEQPTDATVTIDILPGNQVSVIANITAQAFGIQAPMEITGLFELQLTDQAIEVRLVKTEIVGVALPSESIDVFGDDVFIINRDLRKMVDDISKTLGFPIILTNLSTNHDQIQFEARETQ